MLKLISLILASSLLFGCVSSEISSKQNEQADSKFIGKWRSFSDTKNTQVLKLKADNSWTLSSSSGKWVITTIEEKDWERWGVESYGPTRKIIFENWNNQIADGPIEETKERVDFFWIIYTVNLETIGEPAQVQIKYGHTDWQ